jgi:MFS family permease
MTAMFMAMLDNQIVATALPTIVGEFGHLERFSWIGSAYLLAVSAVMPVYGKLGDLFGRKYVMMAAILIFTVGSAVCGLAVSMNTLIAARCCRVSAAAASWCRSSRSPPICSSRASAPSTRAMSASC